MESLVSTEKSAMQAKAVVLYRFCYDINVPIFSPMTNSETVLNCSCI